jgi:aspartate carbamoyltransferase regulatory subunit
MNQLDIIDIEAHAEVLDFEEFVQVLGIMLSPEEFDKVSKFSKVAIINYLREGTRKATVTKIEDLNASAYSEHANCIHMKSRGDE